MAEEEKPAASKPKKKLSFGRLLLIIGIIILVVIVGAGVVILSLLHATQSQQTQYNYGKPSVTVKLVGQDLLSYNNGTQLLPYALFNYSTRNVSDLLVTVSLRAQAPPTRIYMLNTSNECFNCGNINTFTISLISYLTNYTIFNKTNTVHVVQPSATAVQNIPAGSVFIIPNGYLPDFMLSGSSGSTPLDSLLQRGVTVIYIGMNFSRLITSQSVLIVDQNPPTYLSYAGPVAAQQGSFFFNKPTFSFTSGRPYGPLTYEGIEGGHIIAFSNYLNSWSNPGQAASDVASVIFQTFWVPQITYGSRALSSLPRNSSGSLGIAMAQNPLKYSRVLPGTLASMYAEVTVEATNNSLASSSGTFYKLSSFKPSYTINGIIDLPNTTFPGTTLDTEMHIFIRGTSLVEPHVDVYTINMTHVQSFTPIFSKTITSNYTFFSALNFALPAGSYIVQLNGFTGQHYASAYFEVPGATFALTDVNLSQGTYTFQVYAGGQPISNTTANVTLNGKYSEVLTVNNGRLVFTLPIGAPSQTGNLTFSINMLDQVFMYSTIYSPPVVSINKQYIEFIIAIIVVILEITLVKAPTRDDFYIDVPNMPTPQKVSIKIKSNELLSIFDKLNLYYHWKYMPLSNSEFKFAVANNIKVNSMPVSLTYGNAEILLDDLVAKGIAVGADGLYAPSSWLAQSKHDIEYLATFKKLRVYLVGHAHIFTDLDQSSTADIVTTLHNEKAYIVIYSKTSKFMKNLPIQPPIKTYLAFLNSESMDYFKEHLSDSDSTMLERLKIYISSGNVVLVDADNPELILS